MANLVQEAQEPIGLHKPARLQPSRHQPTRVEITLWHTLDPWAATPGSRTPQTFICFLVPRKILVGGRPQQWRLDLVETAMEKPFMAPPERHQLTGVLQALLEQHLGVPVTHVSFQLISWA